MDRQMAAYNRSFNPRTYIRYDPHRKCRKTVIVLFQSTYLYKVRRAMSISFVLLSAFQSTYLYKVRLDVLEKGNAFMCFNPRTYIRYD